VSTTVVHRETEAPHFETVLSSAGAKVGQAVSPAC